MQSRCRCTLVDANTNVNIMHVHAQTVWHVQAHWHCSCSPEPHVRLKTHTVLPSQEVIFCLLAMGSSSRHSWPSFSSKERVVRGGVLNVEMLQHDVAARTLNLCCQKGIKVSETCWGKPGKLLHHRLATAEIVLHAHYWLLCNPLLSILRLGSSMSLFRGLVQELQSHVFLLILC